MLRRSTAVTPGVLDGRLERLRVSVPTPMGDVYLRVDGIAVTGTIEDAAMVRTLRGLQAQAAPVRVGVLTDHLGAHHFSWLMARKGPGVPPRFYVDERKKAWQSLGIGMVLAVASVAGAWMLGISSAWRAVVLAVLLAVALMGLVFAGLSLNTLWFNRRHRAAILESEASYRQYTGKPLVVTPVRETVAVSDTTSGGTDNADADTEANTEANTEADTPPMRRVRGTLTSLTHESRRSSQSLPSFGVYRFVVGKQPYVMTVGENLGDIKPFLAEGDLVEMAIHAADRPGAGPHRLVYAMRNLEDGRVYVCHHGFRGGDRRISPVGVGLSQRTPLLKMVGGLMLTTWLIVVGIGYFSDSLVDDLISLGIYTFIGLFAVWICVALPFVYLNMRWRAGKPTHRQRILERVYQTLGLGTPFAPTERIEEV